MQKILAALVLVLAVALAFTWSSGTRSEPSGPLKEIVLERSSDGHFYADASVNGHTIRFLVDTGAGTVALTEEDAKAAGLPVEPSDYGAIGEGPSGIVRGKFVSLDKLKVQDFAPADVRAAVVALPSRCLGNPSSIALTRSSSART